MEDRKASGWIQAAQSWIRSRGWRLAGSGRHNKPEHKWEIRTGGCDPGGS